MILGICLVIAFWISNGQSLAANPDRVHVANAPATESCWQWRVYADAAIPPKLQFEFRRENGEIVAPQVAVVDSSLWVLSIDRDLIKGGEALVLVVHNTR